MIKYIQKLILTAGRVGRGAVYGWSPPLDRCLCAHITRCDLEAHRLVMRSGTM